VSRKVHGRTPAAARTQPAATPASRRRTFTLAGAGAITAMMLAAPAVHATVTPQAVDPATGFAFSFTDDRNDADPANDVVLGLCMDASGNCIETPRPDPTAPISVDPDNFTPDGEGFYNLADASPPGLGARSLVRLGQEVGFLTDPPWIPGQGTSFYRARFRFSAGLKPNTWYRVTHPLGFNDLRSDGAGTINTTVDLTGGAMPGFLQWDGGGAPAGYVGNYNVPHRVVGSPFGTNFVQVDELPGGPGTAPPLGAQPVSSTDLFSVQGKLAGAPPAPAGNAGLSRTSLAFGTRAIGTTSAAQTVTVTNNGTAAMRIATVSVGGGDAADFAVAATTCGGTTLAVGTSCRIDVTFSPTAAGDRAATLTIADDAPGAPHRVALAGTGAASTTTGGGGGAAAAAGPAAGAPAPATTTATSTPIAIFTIPSASAGSAAARRPPLALERLRTATRVSRRTARRQGIRVVMDVPVGAEIVKVEVYRRVGGTRKLLSSGFRIPSRSGRWVVRQNHAALRRLLKPGAYEVRVTPGRSRSELGRTSGAAFKVV
jgi:hypothetical protein